MNNQLPENVRTVATKVSNVIRWYEKKVFSAGETKCIIRDEAKAHISSLDADIPYGVFYYQFARFIHMHMCISEIYTTYKSNVIFNIVDDKLSKLLKVKYTTDDGFVDTKTRLREKDEQQKKALLDSLPTGESVCDDAKCYKTLCECHVKIQEKINNVKKSYKCRDLDNKMKNMINNLGSRGRKHPKYIDFNEQYMKTVDNNPAVVEANDKYALYCKHYDDHKKIDKINKKRQSLNKLIYCDEARIERLISLKKQIKREIRIRRQCI